jgi:hypothetical protein
MGARDGNREIDIMKNDGSGQKRFIRGPEQQDSRPNYSPDGT